MAEAAQEARSPRRRGSDLSERMVAEAVALARAGGPEAVVLREVARRVGVSAPAAYRHFADHDALRLEVKHHALEQLDAALARAAVRADAQSAREQLRAIGLAYVRWARRNPGLFRAAFEYDVHAATPPRPRTGPAPARRVLSQVVRRMVADAQLPQDRAVWAEEAAWSAVHGVSMLLVAGPLGRAPAAQQSAIVDRVVDMVLAGL